MPPCARRLVGLLLWLAAAFSPALDPSQPIEQYGFDVWTSRQGLPQNSVNVILQTRNGYLWLGTEEGLVRFDGVRFMVYSTRNVAAFRQNTVESLVEAPDGDLWIGTVDGLLRRHGEEFTAYREKDGLPDESITALAVTGDGDLWIGTDHGGLARRTPAGLFTTYGHERGLPDDRITSLATVGGSLWITTAGGLARLRDGRVSAFPVGRDGMAARIGSLYATKKGTLWAASSVGLLQIVGDHIVRTWTGRDGMPDGLPSAMLEDRDGSLWIGPGGGDAGAGIARLRDGRVERYSAAHGLPRDVIVISLFEDLEGSVWIGTVGNGLLRFRPAAVRTFTTLNGLNNDYVHNVLEGPDGTVWAGTRGGGVNAVRDLRVGNPVTVRDGLPGDVVMSLALSAHGDLWIGTAHGGVSLLEKGASRPRAPLTGLPDAGPRALLEDRAGALWIGTAGEGLLRYRNGALDRFRASDAIAGDVVNVLCEARDGSIWAGTNTGLSRWKNGAWTTYRESEGLSSAAVKSLLADADGTLWIGTSGGGLVRLRNGRFQAVQARDGLYDDVVFSILDDRLGNLWMSCNRGIFRVARKDLESFFAGQHASVECRSYDEQDGMKSAECNGSFQPSGWRGRDGSLWFATIQGIALIRPGAIRVNTHEPPVLIERLVVDAKSHPLRKGLEIPPGSRTLQIDFTGLSFLAPEKMRFQYHLKGFDEGWVDAGTRRSAYYTNLSPGDYEFRVIAANGDGIWNRTGAVIAFSIQPSFTQTPLFAVLVLLAAAAAAFGLYRMRVRSLKSKARVLERAITEAMSNIRVLRGLFPICAACKKIRDDGGYWKQIDSYIRDHSEAEFSHSICPECMERLYPDFAAESPAEAIEAEKTS
ncbi:MAG: two-component regulator propeller domain-containing protein [Acidobacteriota bacterium]